MNTFKEETNAAQPQTPFIENACGFIAPSQAGMVAFKGRSDGRPLQFYGHQT
jgi:hypothetical protein